MRSKLLLKLSTTSFITFLFLAATVAFGFWQDLDFYSMVAVQNNIPKSLDQFFSVVSFFGSTEFTVGASLILAIWSLFRRQFKSVLAWLLIIPAVVVELTGKIFIFHPQPSVQFLRALETERFPGISLHTEFSFPSGHMTRFSFLVIALLALTIFQGNSQKYRNLILVTLVSSLLLMALSRVALGEHWLSDVLGGILLGSSAGLLSVHLHLKSLSDKIAVLPKGD